MQIKRESIKVWSEIVKNIAEILAILIAGLWTYNLFLREDAPALELRATIDNNLTWTKLADNNSCEAVMRVHFENTGTSTFDITKVYVTGWKFRLEKSDQTFAEYFDLEKIKRSGELFFEKTYDVANSSEESLLQPFVQHYSPGDMYTHNFRWVITSQQDSQVLFFVKLLSDKGNNQESWITYSWGSNYCE
jgi:hypothetical protein